MYPITAEWDVPLLVARGYSSETFLHASAEVLAAQNRPCMVYQLGDHDPAGKDSARHTETKLREFAPAADITFKRLAVTPEQIDEMGLLTRATKGSDSRSAKFEGESCEVDAIPPSQLRDIVYRTIASHIDVHALRINDIAEQSERELLTRMAGDLS